MAFRVLTEERTVDIQKKSQPSALAGLRVVDLSRILAGPLCTQVLADHGADVIKVEAPGGDDTRTWGPALQEGYASYFLSVNRGKKSVVIDLETDTGVLQLLDLLQGADVLVENLRPGTFSRWGIGDRESIQRRFPSLIHCHISGFGDTGPLGGKPGYDAALQAMVGLMSVNGTADSPATRIGVPVVDMVTGYNAAIGILLALQERHRSGTGQSVDTSLFESGLALMHPHLGNYLQSGEPPARSGNAHPNIVPYDSFETVSGQIFLAVGNDAQFARLCRHLGLDDLVKDTSFATNSDRCHNRAELTALLGEQLEKHHGETLANELSEIGVTCVPVLSLPQILRHPHTAHCGAIIDIDGVPGCASPIRLSRTPASYDRRPPKLDEHAAEIFPADQN